MSTEAPEKFKKQNGDSNSNSNRTSPTNTISNQQPTASPATTTPAGPGRKMYLVKGNKIISVTTITRSPHVKQTGSGIADLPAKSVSPPAPAAPVLQPMKEVKIEPVDEEEVPTGSANITGETPLTLADLLRPPTPTKSTSPPKQIEQQRAASSEVNGIGMDEEFNWEDDKGPSTSTATPQSSKRQRKPTKRYDYVYETPKDAQKHKEEEEEPAKKKQKYDVEPGKCMCNEFIPMMERKMDWMMLRLSSIEHLVKSLVTKQQRQT